VASPTPSRTRHRFGKPRSAGAHFMPRPALVASTLHPSYSPHSAPPPSGFAPQVSSPMCRRIHSCPFPPKLQTALNMEKPIIFLSHSSADREQLSVLKTVLDKRAAGSLDFFLSSDGQSIRFGHNWVVSVSDALFNTKLMFVFLSPQSANSKWIHFEAGCAHAKSVRVVPVCLPGMTLDLVAPPLSLLQGFNLHSHEALANLARIGNDVFEMKIEEVFQPEDFRRVFDASSSRNRGFFGNCSWAVDKLVLYLNLQLSEDEPFDPIPHLAAICKEAKRDFFVEQDTEARGSIRRVFEFPGCSGQSSEDHLSNSERRFKQIYLACDLSPELLHLNAPLLDNWYRQVPFPQPWSARIAFKYPISSEQARHRLTTKLYNSEISLISTSEFAFEGLQFGLAGAAGSSVSFLCPGSLQDPRLPRLVERLFDLNVLFEAPLPPPASPFNL
jgi:hypothetical protein